MYLDIFLSVGSLTLEFYQSGCLKVDFPPLLKALVAKPDIAIMVHSHEPILNANPGAPWVVALVQVLKNRSPRWLGHIAGSGFIGVHIKLVYEVSYETLPPEHRYILYLHIGMGDNAFYNQLVYPRLCGGVSIRLGLDVNGLQRRSVSFIVDGWQYSSVTLF